MCNFIIRGHCHRVFEHHKRQLWVIQRVLLGLGDGQKGLGDDANSRDTSFLEIDRILETPGGTAASFTEAGDDRIRLAHEGFENLITCRAREEGFLGV